MAHVWNDRYGALYDRTYRVLFDAGINGKLADELATHRTLAVALTVPPLGTGTYQSGSLSTVAARKCVLIQAPPVESSARMIARQIFGDREHYTAQRAVMGARSI